MGCVANYAAVSQPQSKWRYLQMQLVLHIIPGGRGLHFEKDNTLGCVHGLPHPGRQTRLCLLLT